MTEYVIWFIILFQIEYWFFIYSFQLYNSETLSDVILEMVEGQRGEWNNRVSNQHHSSAKSIWTI